MCRAPATSKTHRYSTISESQPSGETPMPALSSIRCHSSPSADSRLPREPDCRLRVADPVRRAAVRVPQASEPAVLEDARARERVFLRRREVQADVPVPLPVDPVAGLRVLDVDDVVR